MQVRRLSEAEFKATFAPKMHNVTQTANGVLDVWPYANSVPAGDLEGHRIHDRFVEAVYRTDDGRYDHVLIMTDALNVYLVIVVDLLADTIHGHRLLDLHREYGLSSETDTR